MNYAIDSEFFRGVEVPDEAITRALNQFPKCLMVSGLKQIKTEHKYAWFSGKIVVAPEGYELGSNTFFQEYEHTYRHDKQNETTTMVKIANTRTKIPPISDSTTNDFYVLQFFRDKRIYEMEKERNYPFELIWALNRVSYLREHKWSVRNAIERVAAQSGIDYDTIFRGFSSRASQMRWANRDYKNYKNSRS